MHTPKQCKTRQPSIDFRTDRKSYSESDKKNYEPYLLQPSDQTDEQMSLALHSIKVMINTVHCI